MRRRISIRAILLAATGLITVACGPRAPITQPPVTMSFAQTANQVRVTGIDTITIRSRRSLDGEAVELTGVPCQVNGPGYTASFTTPAAVQLPLFGNAAPQLSLSCQYEGETLTKRIVARNISEEQRREDRRRILDDADDRNSNARIVIALSSPRLRGPGGFDIFRYPDTSLTFRR